jgi:hypothetical protein
MVAEIRVQRALGEGSAKSYPVQLRDVALPDLLADAEHLLRFHPAARGRILSFPPIPPPARLHTDPVLLQRVLGNLVINALEATASGGEVVVEAEAANGTVTLRVRNPGVMPPHVASRVFQRFFSTKDGPGRGHGTWSVKLFTEGSLNGTVDFESAEPRGTVFRLRLPAASPAASG